MAGVPAVQGNGRVGGEGLLVHDPGAFRVQQAAPGRARDRGQRPAVGIAPGRETWESTDCHRERVYDTF